MHARTYIPIVFGAVFFLAPAATFAATISLRATPPSIGVGDIVRIDVLLESAIPTNVFSGTVVYSAPLEPIAVSDGNSIVSAWITHPTVSGTDAPISFAGITPGGFSGGEGEIFSILFQAKAAGTADVFLRNIEVLRNDGVGEKEPVTIEPLTLSIRSTPSGGYVEVPDNIPPEPFTAYQGSDPQLFDGRSYLVFTTTDKGSGIDHYAVAESRLPSFLLPLFPLSWNIGAMSPYVLKDQQLTSTVYVKAVDRAGNERLALYPPHRLFTAYEAVFLVILVGVALLVQRGWGRGKRYGKKP